MGDADILSELREIEEVVGEEVTFDEASLDLDLEDPQPEASPVEDTGPQPAAQPPAPQIEQPKAEEPKPRTRRKAAKPKQQPELAESREAAFKDRAGKSPDETSVTEMVVRTKKLRIIADEVIIEPGDVSFA